ncbi:MAG: diguanylate cyclase/phosphodiesterase [Thermoleophilia bacterium]|nr:diguanylate cyclase/phosphodiesterase [Thermoleophilia bacterium]
MTARLSRGVRGGSVPLLFLCLIVFGYVLVHVAYTQFGFGQGHDELMTAWLYNVALVAAAAIPLLQAVRRPAERAVFVLFGLAILAWALGNIYWQLALSDLESAPFPSLADAGWLAFYPLAYVALVLVIKGRVTSFLPSVWLDGLISVLASAAFVVAFVIGPVLAGVGGSLSAVATNASYPLGDLLLVLLVLLTVAVSGWRLDRQVGLLALGLGTFAIADSLYLYRVAAGTYEVGTVLDSLWLIGIALLAFSSLLEPRSGAMWRYEGWSVVLVPAIFAVAALGLLAYASLTSVPVAAPLLAVAAVLVAFVRAGLTFRDVRLLADARRQAMTDVLTGLFNRRWLFQEIDRLLGATDSPRAALMIVDLNGFKELNDTLGHQTGDAVLKMVGQRLLDAVRGLGQLARLGGDEFAVLSADIASVEECAVRIERGLSEGFVVGELTLSVTASAGIAGCPEHGLDSVALLRCADIALYDAKRRRLLTAVYEPASDEHTVDRLALTSDLRRAIAENELYLVYQPKVSLASGQAIGVEALLRWAHPERGVIFPGEFIPLADAGGLMRPMTGVVLRLALEQARTWLNAGTELPVSVNISVTDLIDIMFPKLIERLLDDHDVPSSMLQLEITETELMVDSDRAEVAVERLTALGVRVGLDDFGMGYSSLKYLQQLRLSELKIDHTFVKNMTTRDSDAAIVRCAIEMARALGLTVVAEGVEDRQAAAMLSEFGCDAAQGYDIAHPMSVTDLEHWLVQRRTLAA